MDQYFVMTMIGNDRPGLVEKVAGLVASHGGNWLESRMCHLGGEFAGILRLSIPGASEASFTNGLKELETGGLSIALRKDTAAAPAGERTYTQLEILGQDRPGIVREISRALAEHQVNVEELETECVSAPMSGEMLFRAKAKLRVPTGADTSSLRQKLEKIATDLAIDVSLSEVEKLRP